MPAKSSRNLYQLASAVPQDTIDFVMYYSARYNISIAHVVRDAIDILQREARTRKVDNLHEWIAKRRYRGDKENVTIGEKANSIHPARDERNNLLLDYAAENGGSKNTEKTAPD